MLEPPVTPPGEPPDNPANYSEPEPTDLVTFSVICRPASGVSLTEFRERFLGSRSRWESWRYSDERPRPQTARLAIEALLPSESTLHAVEAELRLRGFEVFDDLSRIGVVFARGTVALFEFVFRTNLAMMTRRSLGDVERSTTAIVLRDGAPPPSIEAIADAFLVAVSEPPLPATSTVTGATAATYCMTLPEQIADVTRAIDVHQLPLPDGARCTGMGVKVAVVDTGFADHPYFLHRGYHITRIAAHDASHPEIDDDNHGTFVLANLLACAPGAHAYGVKYEDAAVAFARAALIPGIRVIALSWMFEIRGPLPDWMLLFEFLTEIAVQQFRIIVVVAAGNRARETSPARLPWTIAVGGVSVVDPAFSLMAWPSSSSFGSIEFPARWVPDVCGVASQINLPLPPAQMMCLEGGTSCATPQVAGVAALLLQKNPALTPFEVQSLLKLGATDVSAGKSFSDWLARTGWDPATGYGLVDALTSWLLVP